jgi:hypothetical protein
MKTLSTTSTRKIIYKVSFRREFGSKKERNKQCMEKIA